MPVAPGTAGTADGASDESGACPATEGEPSSPAQLRQEFNGVRSQYWQNEAASNPGAYSPEDLARMEQGKPPIGEDGYPMELHHNVPFPREVRMISTTSRR
jgi:hypothetical protein